MTFLRSDVVPLDETTCLHHYDADTKNKCYEACGSGSFVVKGLDAKGACPDEFTENIKGEKGLCLHKVEQNKCFEGCAPAKFAMKGLSSSGVCPSSFSVTEKKEEVLSCSDGVTNTKYCTTPLYVVNVTMR